MIENWTEGARFLNYSSIANTLGLRKTRVVVRCDRRKMVKIPEDHEYNVYYIWKDGGFMVVKYFAETDYGNFRKTELYESERLNLETN